MRDGMWKILVSFYILLYSFIRSDSKYSLERHVHVYFANFKVFFWHRWAILDLTDVATCLSDYVYGGTKSHFPNVFYVFTYGLMHPIFFMHPTFFPYFSFLYSFPCLIFTKYIWYNTLGTRLEIATIQQTVTNGREGLLHKRISNYISFTVYRKLQSENNKWWMLRVPLRV